MLEGRVKVEQEGSLGADLPKQETFHSAVASIHIRRARVEFGTQEHTLSTLCLFWKMAFVRQLK